MIIRNAAGPYQKPMDNSKKYLTYLMIYISLPPYAAGFFLLKIALNQKGLDYEINKEGFTRRGVFMYG